MSTMQQGMQRMEARAQGGKPASMLRERTEGARQAVWTAAREERVLRFRQGVARAGAAVRAVMERMRPAVRQVATFVRAERVEGRKARAKA